MIKKGDRVFFADNSKDYLERCKAFGRTARGLGLVPVFYGGAGAAVQQSNQDREMRDDFYGAQAIVLYFGAPKDELWAEVGDGVGERRRIMGVSKPPLLH